MKLSKRSFSIKFNFEVQWLSSLCDYGIVPFEEKKGKRTTILIDSEVLDTLEVGDHYVECSFCMKKMGSITKSHYGICAPDDLVEPVYSKIYLRNHQKTEEQKINQSEVLKERFKTPEGEITRKQIGEASIKLNADPDFKARKSIISTEVNNRPENKLKKSEDALKMWADPEFRKRMDDYVEENRAKIEESAHRAREHLTKKTSKLHTTYKENMVKMGVLGFETEYQCDYYSIDEADPFSKIALEVDGCYWHGCDLCGFPGEDRIKATDNRKTSYLQDRGWLIIRVKEHDLKKDPFFYINQIKQFQEKRSEESRNLIKKSFLNGTLRVKSMVEKNDIPQWVPVSDVLRHNTPHKKMMEVITETGSSTKVTEDHSLFEGVTRDPQKTSDIKIGDSIVGLVGKIFGPINVVEINEHQPEQHTYDLSVPGSENFVLDSGVLAHNSYSISGVSLDIDKSSKYQSMKENFIQEYDKVVDAAKRSIKIIKGLRQPRYGIGISSALGPFSSPGVQSRANWVRSGGGFT